jgi:hypothetical protein
MKRKTHTVKLEKVICYSSVITLNSLHLILHFNNHNPDKNKWHSIMIHTYIVITAGKNVEDHNFNLYNT